MIEGLLPILGFTALLAIGLAVIIDAIQDMVVRVRIALRRRRMGR